MKTHTLQTSLWLPRPVDEVFPFFADAHNLGEITPPWVHFRILTPKPIVMEPGALIDYTIRLRGVPMKWQTEITRWEPPYLFVDEQRRGPYRLWIHEHRFVAKDGGTLCEDRVDYAVPGGWLIHRLFVEGDVRRIFAYRQQRLQMLLGRSDAEAEGAHAQAVAPPG